MQYSQKSLGKTQRQRYRFVVQKTVRKFGRLAETEKADREFYKKLSGHERLRILVELLNQTPEQRIERVFRITKLPRN